MPITEEQKLRIAEIAKKINDSKDADYYRELVSRRFDDGGDTDDDDEIIGYIDSSGIASRQLKPWSRRAIKAFANEDFLNQDYSTVTEGRAKTRKQRLYNRTFNKAAAEYAKQEADKALERMAIEELQTGEPTGAFKELTRQGVESGTPIAAAIMTGAVAPWLSQSVPVLGSAAAKGLELMGEYAMPSTFLKGVSSVIPSVSKAAAAASPWLDAGALSLWSAQGMKHAGERWKEGDKGTAIAEGALASLPVAMPLGIRAYQAGKSGLNKFNNLRNQFKVTPEDFKGIAETMYRDNTANFPDKPRPVIKQEPEIYEPIEASSSLRGVTAEDWAAYDKYAEDSISRVVNDDGTINKKALQSAYKKVLEYVNEKYPSHHSIKEKYHSSFGNTNLKQHLEDVVKTAQEIPVPEGSSRAELVRAALTHDLGKIVTGQESGHHTTHGAISREILEGLGLPEFNSETLQSAVGVHMDDFRHPIYGSHGIGTIDDHGVQRAVNWDLIHALQASDVARGLGYDEAAISFPQLFTYKRANPAEVQFATGTPEWELSNVVNPILKRQGYPHAHSQAELGDTILRHRSTIRAVRDPYKADTEIEQMGPVLDPYSLSSSPEDSRNALNAADAAMKYYGEDTPATRLKVSLENIPLDPTGSGRAGLFHVSRSQELPKHKRDVGSARLKVSPEEQDALYMSVSPELSESYFKTSHERPSEVARVNFPVDYSHQDSPTRFLADNEWQLYDLGAVTGNPAGVYSGDSSPMSTWQLFEEPYRLQTGRSLKSDMAAGYEGQRLKNLGSYEPHEFYSGDRIKNVQAAIERFGDTKFSPVRVESMPDLYSSGKAYYNKYFPKFAENINKFQKYLSGNNSLELPKGVLSPKQEVMARRFKRAYNEYAKKVSPKKVVDNVKSNLLSELKKHGIENQDAYDLVNSISSYYDRGSTKQILLPPEMRSDAPTYTLSNGEELTQYDFENKLFDILGIKHTGYSNPMDFSIVDDFDTAVSLLRSNLDYSIRYPETHVYTDEELLSRRQKIQEYYDKYIFNKTTYNKLKNAYFEELKKAKGKRGLTKEYKAYMKDPINYARFMRSKGLLPLYDMPGFGRTEAFAGTSWGDKPMLRNEKPHSYGAPQAFVIGKKGEKIFESAEIDPDVLYKNLRKFAGRDSGQRLLDESAGVLVTRKTFPFGGKIHIKPENRGKFTALKKRTGHSATWFKEHGTPAQKKMATFALNSKHWNHADGGPMSRGFLTPNALPTLLQQFTPNRQIVDYPQVESLNLPEQYVPEPAVIRTPIVDLSKYETAPEVVVPYTPEASAEIIANQEYDSMLDNILNRQRYAESGFNDRAVNKSSGATGAYQIMPIAYKDYLQRGHGKEGDLMNASYNRLVRDHVVKMVPRDLGSEFYSPADTAVNRHAKEMAVFNAGAGPVKKALRKAKAAGVDIVNTTDWIQYLPSKETRDYVNFVVLDQDIAGTGKNAESYNRAYSRFQNSRDLGGMVEKMKSLYNNDKQAMLDAISRKNLNKRIK